MDGFKDIPDPQPSATLATSALLQAGPPLSALKRIFTYDASEWEGFIEEWLSTLKAKYSKVQRASGSNDRGIDVAAFTDAKMLEGVWDNYQCKHYGKPIGNAEVFPEIGKIIWHSFNKHYLPPRACYFLAPRNASTTTSQLLANITRLKAEVLKVWDKSISTKITDTQAVTLDGEFAAYVQNFDFSIFKLYPVRSVLEEHAKTHYHLGRFGGGMPARPKPAGAPDEIAPHESMYVEKLLAAYADHKKETVPDAATLKQWNSLAAHFQRQREAFYHAEGLRVFVRDKVEPGTFESLQDEIYNGVIDTAEANHEDGYRRVVAVTERAATISLEAHALGPSALVQDRHGICHQLANEDRLTWKK
jgi:hypothetical protein